jgi:DNA/RNA endonuclease YhcR with UshA esterase domain
MRNAVILVGVFALLILVQVKAQDAPTTAPTSQPSLIGAGDEQTLNADMGNEVIVQGTISDAKWSPSGRVFLIKFQEGESSEFQGAILSKYKDMMEKAFNGDLTIALEGAKVQIHGKLQTYREHPEILIDKPEQIVITVKGPGKMENATTAPSSQPSP